MENSERTTGVISLVAEAKTILAGKPPSRAALAAILEQLEALAARQHLWSDADYPMPAGAREALYLIAEEADRGFAVYLNIMIAGSRVPPHNHSTWACIAAVAGCEHNYIYERLDDGARPGQAQIRKSSTVRVEPGRGIALMPDDIHAIEGKEEGVMRHLHFYGRALEVLSERLIFDPLAGTCKPMALATPIRRA